MLAGAALVVAAILAVKLWWTSLPVADRLWAVRWWAPPCVMLLPLATTARQVRSLWPVSIAVLVVVDRDRGRFKPGGDQYQFVESHTWIPSFGTGYILGVDGIALALVVLTAVLVPILISPAGTTAATNGCAGRQRTTSR